MLNKNFQNDNVPGVLLGYVDDGVHQGDIHAPVKNQLQMYTYLTISIENFIEFGKQTVE